MKTAPLLLATLMTLTTSASAALSSPGDIAFTGFNADGDDNLAFVLLVSASPGQKIWFTDNEWNGNSFNGGESYYSWTAPAGGLAAGTVVTLDNINSGSPSTNLGLGAEETVAGSTNAGISITDEAIYAYLGTTATNPTAFLSLIANEDTSVPYSLTNTGLSEAAGTAIIFTADEDGMRYTGPRNSLMSFSGYLSLLANKPANWEVTAGDGTTFLPMDTTAFSIVPEPGSLLLGLLPIGGLLLRRRR